VPLSVAGLPAVFSVYYGFWMAVAWRLGTRGIAGVLTAALAWFLADYTRGHMFSGFPWNLEGYAWSGILPMLQITSVIGIYGLTLLTLVAAFLPALLAEKKDARNGRIIIASLIILALIGGWGGWRLAQGTQANVPDVRLRLVQPNVDQKHKWDSNRREADFQELLALTSAPLGAGEKPVTDVIWPEAAPTYYLTEDPVHREAIAEHIPAGGALITGVIRRSLDERNELQYHNSLIAINSYGDVIAEYDKHHLVPFGEYIPYHSVFPLSLRPLIHLGVDFTPGDRAYTLHIPGFPPFSPLICYEVIFTGDVIAADDRPQLLLNVTNDGWYGDTSGPYQHFAMARVRAIEEGLPLARAANTGISGVVDAYGRVRTQLVLDTSGYTDSDLPVAISPTFFSHYRDLPFWVLFMAFAFAAGAMRHISRS
jgi:apolipoprotein N-acyltransferase